MPILGLGLHFLVALFFAVHAMRTGRNMYWLIILFSFPLLGSLVYLFAEYLPGSVVQRSINKAAALASNMLDPERELREARAALDLSPSAQNQVRLAKALLAHGDAPEAAKLFDACLSGPFGKESDIRFGAASANHAAGQHGVALAILQGLRVDRPEFQPEQVGLLQAEVQDALGDVSAARAGFADMVQRFGSVDALVAYGVWAAANNDLGTARKMREDLAKLEQHWEKYSRDYNKANLRRLDAAITAAGGR